MSDFSYDIRYLPDSRLFWIIYRGNPGLDEFSRVHVDLIRRPEHAPDIDLLLDLREGSLVNITTSEFRLIYDYMLRDDKRDQRLHAAVIRDRLDYGLLRMFTGRLDPLIEAKRESFDSLEEAIGWLRPDSADATLREIANWTDTDD